MKLQEYFMCAKRTEITTSFNNSPPLRHPGAILESYHNAWDQKALGFHQKYLNLCSKDEWRSYRFAGFQKLRFLSPKKDSSHKSPLEFLLGWNNSYTNYVCICFSVSATGELHKLQSGSNPKWSEMTKHLRRDDTNPSEDLRGCQPSDNIQNYQILP